MTVSVYMHYVSVIHPYTMSALQRAFGVWRGPAWHHDRQLLYRAVCGYGLVVARNYP